MIDPALQAAFDQRRAYVQEGLDIAIEDARAAIGEGHPEDRVLAGLVVTLREAMAVQRVNVPLLELTAEAVMRLAQQPRYDRTDGNLHP